MAKNTKAQTTLKFIGGVNKDRIGGNCSVIEHTDSKGKSDIIMVDFGSMFTPYETGFVAAFPNVDEYFDRKDPITKEETKALKPVKAMFITHAHEDHIGALVNYVRMGYKLPPIKTSCFTRNFIRLAFKQQGVMPPEIEKINANETIKISDNMEIRAVDISHIVGSLGFCVTTYDNGKPCADIINNGDFLTEEEMPVGKSFNKENYIETLKSAKCPIIMCLDSTSTSPHSSERIGFEQAVENTYNTVMKHSNKSIIVSPVISRSVQNIAIDVEVARRLGTKICLDGKWLSLVKDTMTLSGYKDFDDVIYKGTLKGYLSDKTINKKYVVCTGAFAQGMENYEYNLGFDDISPIPLAAATKMALDIHPYIKINQNVLVLSRQRIIEEINGKTGPKMLQMMAAQGATVVMTPSGKPIGNFEEVRMQDSGHANATAIRNLMQDVKEAVDNVVVIPIHGNPYQCADTKKIMDQLGIETHIVGNKEGIHISEGKISDIEPKCTPLTWFAARQISPNPFSERDVPLDGITEYWEVTEQYEPVRKMCEIDNTQKQAPLPREHSANVRYLEKAEGMPTREKIKKRKNRKGMSVVEMSERKKGRRR